jgi:hypothetical protein
VTARGSGCEARDRGHWAQNTAWYELEEESYRPAPAASNMIRWLDLKAPPVTLTMSRALHWGLQHTQSHSAIGSLRKTLEGSLRAQKQIDQKLDRSRRSSFHRLGRPSFHRLLEFGHPVTEMPTTRWDEEKY